MAGNDFLTEFVLLSYDFKFLQKRVSLRYVIVSTYFTNRVELMRGLNDDFFSKAGNVVKLADG